MVQIHFNSRTLPIFSLIFSPISVNGRKKNKPELLYKNRDTIIQVNNKCPAERSEINDRSSPSHDSHVDGFWVLIWVCFEVDIVQLLLDYKHYPRQIWISSPRSLYLELSDIVNKITFYNDGSSYVVIQCLSNFQLVPEICLLLLWNGYLLLSIRWNFVWLYRRRTIL